MCGKGSGGVEWCWRMGPAGMVRVRGAGWPERAKVVGWKVENQDVTSEGGEEVKRRPTWPFSCC